MAFMGVAWATSVWAAPEDFAKFYEIDMDEKLPPYAELYQKYVIDNKIVDRKYDYHWDMGNVFDKVFRLTITSYGGTEKRLKNENEEALMQMLAVMPPETYQYIGPYLHTVPNISDKVLNMPGIKETKNQFPKRIAHQLEGIEDLEFLSPYLYYVLMPEVWPDYRQTLEKVDKQPAAAKVKHNPKFFAKLKDLVPEDEFLPDASQEPTLGMSDLRTIEPTKGNALTSADVQAFVATLDKVDAWGRNLNNFQKIYQAGYLIDSWEKENGKALPVNTLKDVVNPCQRLVQKVKYAGLEREFTDAVIGEGFDINGWAYTCDKTIKAYRISMMTRSAMASVLMYKNGVYNYYTDLMDDKSSEMQYSTMQSVIEMYQAPIADVFETRKNRIALREKLNKMGNRIGGSAGGPVALVK